MDLLLANDDDDHYLVVNGEVLRSRDVQRDRGPHPDPLLPHVQREEEEDDDDDAATSINDCSDVDELSESENEGGKDAMMDIFRKIWLPHPPHFRTLPKTVNEADEPSLGNSSKEKGKERERTTQTPEPQVHGTQACTDLLRFIIGGHLEATEQRYQYAADEECGAKQIRGAYEHVGDADYHPPRGNRRRDMFASHFMPPYRIPSRRVLPEFIAGPSRITLDDLY